MIVSEEEHVILPVLWNIRDFDVFFESLVKILELFLQHSSLLRVLKTFQALSKIVCLFGITKSLESTIIVLSPMSFLKFLELSIDIIGLILNNFKSFVINMDTVISLFNVFIKSTKELINFLLKCLTFWRFLEFFIKLSECLSFISFS